MTYGRGFRRRSPMTLLAVSLIALGVAVIAAGLFFWLAVLR